MVIIQLERDQKIRDRWRVVRKLAEGGFGAVYLAFDEKTEDECAVKIEPCDQNSVLKLEAHVLMQLRSKSAHACAFLGCGRIDMKINYLVMTLVGRSFSDLLKSRPDRCFSKETVARLALQCFEALEELHEIGFVHRDVKPGNLAIGRTDSDQRTVYLLDFGLARRWTDPTKDNNAMRSPRKGCGFRGTVRYASINVHAGLEQGRHDDLISLIYVLVEYRSGQLPWRDVDDDDDVGKAKKMIEASVLLKDMDEEYAEIYDGLGKLDYKQVPDYDSITMQIAEMQKAKDYPIDGPFEWEELINETAPTVTP